MTVSTPIPSRLQTLYAMSLEPWLDVGDPLAEDVVAVLRTHPGALADPVPAIRALAADGDHACRRFLDDVETPPDWADFDLMRAGGAMMYRHFPHYVIATAYGGLMTTFCSADAAYILARTGRLERNVVRRMNESGELFFGVLDAEQLRPGRTVWEVCVRVRLMHTMVRLTLRRAGDRPLLGTPINALHTAAGPVFFGAMTLDRLRLLGGRFTDREADGFYLIWRYVTRLLGVPSELLGTTTAEQRAIDARILPLSFDPDDTSRRLAEALITGLTTMPRAERLPRSAHEALARRMLGDERADAMGIPRGHTGGNILANAVTLGLRCYGWAQRLPAVDSAAGHLGRRMAQRLVCDGLQGTPPDYRA